VAIAKNVEMRARTVAAQTLNDRVATMAASGRLTHKAGYSARRNSISSERFRQRGQPRTRGAYTKKTGAGPEDRPATGPLRIARQACDYFFVLRLAVFFLAAFFLVDRLAVFFLAAFFFVVFFLVDRLAAFFFVAFFLVDRLAAFFFVAFFLVDRLAVFFFVVRFFVAISVAPESWVPVIADGSVPLVPVAGRRHRMSVPRDQACAAHANA